MIDVFGLNGIIAICFGLPDIKADSPLTKSHVFLMQNARTSNSLHQRLASKEAPVTLLKGWPLKVRPKVRVK